MRQSSGSIFDLFDKSPARLRGGGREQMLFAYYRFTVLDRRALSYALRALRAMPMPRSDTAAMIMTMTAESPVITGTSGSVEVV